MDAIDTRVLQSVYALCDDIDYNLYEAVDIAFYAKLDEAVVNERLHALYDQGYLGECMSIEDDGMETFHLTNKAMEHLDAV